MTAISANAIDSITVDVFTDYQEYTEFQNIQVFVRAFSEKGGIMELVVEQRNATGSLISNVSQLVNVTDYSFYLPVGKPGTYSVTAKAIQNGNIGNAITSFSVVSVFDTNTSKFLIVATIFFAALLILIIVSKENNATEEILRFLFLSGIVASILLSLLFTQLEYGAASAVGLMRSNIRVINETAFVANPSPYTWVFHIGNELYVPLYVVVFGLIGGYLRYLYKTSRLLIDKDLRKETEDLTQYLTDQNVKDVGRRVIFFESLKDLSLFFLAPILAVVTWFLFSQWEPIADSDTLLAVFSFSAGLVTTEIVKAITDFTKRNLVDRTATTNPQN